MIGYIRGKVTGVFEDSCFLETGGIGYRIYISGRDRENLHVGDEVKLITYLAVREDALTLYGFLDDESHDLFLLLLAVSKIGPKVAMGILSSVKPAQFSMAVQNKDMSVLTKLPGIGKKTAERLILELKDKLGAFEEVGLPAPAAVLPANGSAAEEAVAALCSLGYSVEEVHDIVYALAASISDTGALINASLREIGKRQAEV